MEELQDEVIVSSPSVYSAKSAPAARKSPRSISRSPLFRRSPKSDSKKSVHSDGYRRRKSAYVALDDSEEENGTKKKAIVNSSPELEEVTKMQQHPSTRSLCSDRDRNQSPKNGTASKLTSSSSVAMSLPERFSSPTGKSQATLKTLLRVLNPPSSSSNDEEESFYSAGGFPATSPLDTRAEVERLVHCIMPEEDQNVEQMLQRFQGRETVLLQTLFTLYEQQAAISKTPKKKKKRVGETSNASTPSGLVARDRLGRIARTDAGSSSSNLQPRSLASLLRLHNSDTTVPQRALSQKENDGGASFSLKSKNTISSASFATPRSKSASINTPAYSKGTSLKSYNSMGAESLVVNPGSIGSVVRRYWDSTTGDLVEPTTTEKTNKTSSVSAASHARTDPGGHCLDDGNNEHVLVGSRSVSGNPYREATKEERHLAIEFALETGDWEKVEQVGAGVSDNSVSTISTDSELLLGMDDQVELQFVDALEENDEVVKRGSPSTLSIDAREVLAQRIEHCASQLDAVIEEDDWSAVMEIINKYTGRDKSQTLDSEDEVVSGQDVANEVTLNESSCASIPSIGTQDDDKDSSKKAVEACIESESSLSAKEAVGQEVEIAVSDTMGSSVQKADDQGGCERSKVVANEGSRRGKKISHKQSPKDKVNKDSIKKKTIEESVEIYMKEAQQQQEDEKNTITGMSFDVQQKEDLSLLSMNSAGQSNYSNPQSELIGKLKKAIKAADWNEVQILGQSLETGDIEGIAAIREFKTLKKDPPTGEPAAQDEDKYVQIAMSSSSQQQWENQDHESMSMKMISKEEESAVTGPPESHLDDDFVLDEVVDDHEEGIEAVLPNQQALTKPAKPHESTGANQAPTKPSTSNEASQECTCDCVIS